jgi:hypothetical protein
MVFSATALALGSILMISVDLVLLAALILSGRTYSTSTWKSRFMYWLEVVIKYIVMRRSFALSSLFDSLRIDYRLTRETELQEWVNLKSTEEKIKYPVTDKIRFAIDRFLFSRYCLMFRNGVFARCNRSM